MSDRVLAEALQARNPSALAAVYDAYADRLYSYCWFQLADHAAARKALRDTLIVADAHIGRLRDSDRFGPWMYALARVECARRMPYGAPRGRVPDADHGEHADGRAAGRADEHDHHDNEDLAGRDHEGVDLQITAWRSVLALPPLSREILELRFRQRLTVSELTNVLGLPEAQIRALLLQARAELDAALTAEILARKGTGDCPARAMILQEQARQDRALQERGAGLTTGLRERLLQHARECDRCGAHRSRAISAAKVYGILPTTRPPKSLRAKVLDCFRDPDFTGYRFFVATRAGEFDENGFPLQPERTLPTRRPSGCALSAQRTHRHPVLLYAAAGLLLAVLGTSLMSVPERLDGCPARTRPTPAPPGARNRDGVSAAPTIPSAPAPGDRGASTTASGPMAYVLTSRWSGLTPFVPAPSPSGVWTWPGAQIPPNQRGQNGSGNNGSGNGDPNPGSGNSNPNQPPSPPSDPPTPDVPSPSPLPPDTSKPDTRESNTPGSNTPGSKTSGSNMSGPDRSETGTPAASMPAPNESGRNRTGSGRPVSSRSAPSTPVPTFGPAAPSSHPSPDPSATGG